MHVRSRNLTVLVLGLLLGLLGTVVWRRGRQQGSFGVEEFESQSARVDAVDHSGLGLETPGAEAAVERRTLRAGATGDPALQVSELSALAVTGEVFTLDEDIPREFRARLFATDDDELLCEQDFVDTFELSAELDEDTVRLELCDASGRVFSAQTHVATPWLGRDERVIMLAPISFAGHFCVEVELGPDWPAGSGPVQVRLLGLPQTSGSWPLRLDPGQRPGTFEEGGSVVALGTLAVGQVRRVELPRGCCGGYLAGASGAGFGKAWLCSDGVLKSGSRIVLPFTRFWEVAVKVTDVEGAGVAGVTLLSTQRVLNRCFSDLPSICVKTDASGLARFTALLPSAMLVAQLQGFESKRIGAPHDRAALTVVLGRERAAEQAEDAEGESESTPQGGPQVTLVCVESETGLPLGGIMLDMRGSLERYARTDAAGCTVATRVSADSELHVLVISLGVHKNHVLVPLVNETTFVSLVVPAGVAERAVLEFPQRANPLAAIKVTAVGATGAQSIQAITLCGREALPSGTFEPVVYTFGDAQVRCRFVPQGRGLVWVTTMNGDTGVAACDVRGNKVVDCRVSVGPPRTIAGRVTGLDANLSSDVTLIEATVEGAVDQRFVPPYGPGQWDWFDLVEVDSSGRFVMEALVPGIYELRIEGSPSSSSLGEFDCRHGDQLNVVVQWKP